jgi:hypothetical protein
VSTVFAPGARVTGEIERTVLMLNAPPVSQFV